MAEISERHAYDHPYETLKPSRDVRSQMFMSRREENDPILTRCTFTLLLPAEPEQAVCQLSDWAEGSPVLPVLLLALLSQ